ncbi:MAG: CRISPR-associated endonuclease Cas2 [Marinospirillum sp.]|uniref:CRISPR-associated endonuclease Cas2 n=1 Tax=Marinospirillum sp. TaxID=2183934 RepID=UPI001A0B583A|nr:CRISPR-associated endonuclease Cas2 [Marinospirillum sp.]MBE0508232.1 CRISPR-associated endonuclease Cas2 [Marinospirillum sp.]
MSKRGLYFLAYDLGIPRLQRQARKHLRHQASGQQLSAFECYLTGVEKGALVQALQQQTPQSESLFCIRLDSQREPIYLGQAQPPLDEDLVLVS